MSLFDKKIGWYLVVEVIQKEFSDQPDVASNLLSAMRKTWFERESALLKLEFESRINSQSIGYRPV